MKHFIFSGGREQLIVRLGGEREISVCYPPLLGTDYLNEKTVLKKTSREDAAKYLFKKKHSTDKDFEEYLISEFTKGIWAGFKHIKTVEK